MKTELAYFNIFPKIFRARREGLVSIVPRGLHSRFEDGRTYAVTVIPMRDTILNEEGAAYPEYQVLPRDGTIRFAHTFGDEGPYLLRVRPKDLALPPAPQRKRWPSYLEPHKFRVYALEEDLFPLRPWRGDMHVHSFRSDGKEAPAVVVSAYRKAGFDFLALTDHEQYEPSLEAIKAFKDAPIDLKLFPGEEVHPPGDNTHYVNFAGNYSLNDIFRNEKGRYQRETEELAKSIEVPPGINRFKYASCLWVCGEIKKAEGLSIMTHPHWIQEDAFHIGEKMCRYMLENAPFDAFELTGGMAQAENQLQTSLWQQLRAEGRSVPIVGSSDSHGTEVPLSDFNVSKMVILAERCDKGSLIAAVRDRRVVVLEQYAGESLPRLYGEYRYVAYMLFLLTEYFPLHDELCFEEGRLMKEYAAGDKEAARDALPLLKALQGRCAALMDKCWGSLCPGTNA
jgi:hypothetical protein